MSLASESGISTCKLKYQCHGTIHKIISFELLRSLPGGSQPTAANAELKSVNDYWLLSQKRFSSNLFCSPKQLISK